jgi:hypothetical protein
MMDFPTLTNCTVFPLPEGTHLEFKATVYSCPFEKILATLCGLLNSGGGHLVVGVEDGTLRILGVKTDKTMDKFLLQVDNVYQQALIKKADGTPLPIGAVKAETLAVSADKTLVVITMSAEPGEKYTMKDGTIWYRLASSNYKQTALPTVYSEERVELLVSKKLADQEETLRAQFDAEKAQLAKKADDELTTQSKRLRTQFDTEKALLQSQFDAEKAQLTKNACDDLTRQSKRLRTQFDAEKELLQTRHEDEMAQQAQKAGADLVAQGILLQKQFNLAKSKLVQTNQTDHEALKLQFKKLESDFENIVQAAKQREEILKAREDAVKRREEAVKQVREDAQQMEEIAKQSELAAKQMEEECDTFRIALYKSIELQRLEAEQRLAREKEGTDWLSHLMNYF